LLVAIVAGLTGVFPVVAQRGIETPKKDFDLIRQRLKRLKRELR